jgi:hypothetical protein
MAKLKCQKNQKNKQVFLNNEKKRQEILNDSRVERFAIVQMLVLLIHL